MNKFLSGLLLTLACLSVSAQELTKAGTLASPHNIEFILGTGVVLDGTTYTSGGPLQVTGGSTGPWTIVLPGTWVVSAGRYSGTGGGCGGAAGANNATNAAGGGGGPSGSYAIGQAYIAYPGDTLSITVGAKGTGGLVAGTAATAGGSTILSNSTSNTRDPLLAGAALTLHGGGINQLNVSAVPTQPTAGVSQVGGAGGANYNGTGGGAGGAATGAAGTGANGNAASFGALSGSYPGSGGGGAGPATAGAGGMIAGYQFPSIPTSTASAASGNLGGGGFGGPNQFGLPGASGGGGSAAGNATGYGAGGSGGGGNGAGGNGAPGYLRIEGMF